MTHNCIYPGGISHKILSRWAVDKSPPMHSCTKKPFSFACAPQDWAYPADLHISPSTQTGRGIETALCSQWMALLWGLVPIASECKSSFNKAGGKIRGGIEFLSIHLQKPHCNTACLQTETRAARAPLPTKKGHTPSPVQGEGLYPPPELLPCAPESQSATSSLVLHLCYGPSLQAVTTSPLQPQEPPLPKQRPQAPFL